MDDNKKISVEGHLPSPYVEEIMRLHNINPFAVLLGIEIDGLAENYCHLRLPPDKKNTNPYGGVHGGVLATLADIAMSIAVRTIGLRPVTAELTVNYLSQPQPGDRLFAEGRVVHRGKTLLLTEGTVKSEEGKTVAMARAIFINRGPLLHT
ncbi:MAG: PaaI family thioesterase [Peptococcaceae bacterium]|nr:PaaI family thioesterase [Peptococcaceae bacterium]